MATNEGLPYKGYIEGEGHLGTHKIINKKSSKPGMSQKEMLAAV